MFDPRAVPTGAPTGTRVCALRTQPRSFFLACRFEPEGEEDDERAPTNPIRLALATLRGRACERAGTLYLDGRPIRTRDLIAEANVKRSRSGARQIVYGAVLW